MLLLARVGAGTFNFSRASDKFDKDDIDFGGAIDAGSEDMGIRAAALFGGRDRFFGP